MCAELDSARQLLEVWHREVSGRTGLTQRTPRVVPAPDNKKK